MDQKNSQLEVDYAIGRDIRPGDIGIIVSTLQDWCNACEAVLGCVETQIDRANSEKNKNIKHKDAIEQEVRLKLFYRSSTKTLFTIAILLIIIHTDSVI